jgi:Ser/Thr protein kinase RdoA (MazF antagonist)
VELLAEGRTAEVFAYGEGRVLKLDRPEWNGLSHFEATVLEGLADAGVAVARPHGTVTVEGRSGVVLSRVDGPSLFEVLTASSPAEAEELARHFAAVQLTLNAIVVGGLPDLVPRLRGEIEASVTDVALRTELVALLAGLDDGGHGVCHYDFHPLNVLVGAEGWVVIDWLTVAAGPAAADLARTLVLVGRWSTEPLVTFSRAVRRIGQADRGLRDEDLDAWIRVVAAARLGEGFRGADAAWLLGVAGGSTPLFR